MMTYDSTLVVALMSLLSAVIVGLMQVRKWRSEGRADEGRAARDISQAAVSLVEPLRKRLEILEAEIAELKTRNTELEAHVGRLEGGMKLLIDQITKLGYVPVFTLTSDK